MNEVEFKIDTSSLDNVNRNNLILSLVHAGYSVYKSYDNDYICFTGIIEDVVTQKVEVIE